MKCSQFHELAAGYALDALQEDERIACAEHMAHEGPHEGCEELLRRYERTASALSRLWPVRAPSPAIWSAIEARLGKRSGARWREPAAWALAAAALLAGVWLRGQAVERAQHSERERDSMEQALANTSDRLTSAEGARKECTDALAQLTGRGALGRDAVSMLEQPDTRLTPLSPAGARPYRATALYNPKTKRAVVVSGTIQPIAGRDFELWVIAAGEAPRPAGFLRFDPSGIALGEFDATLLAGKPPAAFAVSLEPAGGRPTPTEVVLLGKIQG
ncbi:MAG TPA: anti-sigma factor [Polyangiales bacterium]